MRRGQGGGVIIECGADLAPHVLTVARLAGSGRAVLILFLDPDAEDSTLVDRLRSIFGLTPAEARCGGGAQRRLGASKTRAVTPPIHQHHPMG